jgi:hypothetical protein
MKEPRYISVLSWAGLGVAVVLLTLGAKRDYPVHPDENQKNEVVPVSLVHEGGPPPEAGLGPPLMVVPDPPATAPGPLIRSLSDLKMVENTTFTGVIRKEKELFFTYDPTKKGGKRACPT